MYVADSKRLTHQGAKMMVDAAVTKARSAGIAISCAVVDAGGHLIAFERMDGGRFHTAAFVHHQGGVRGVQQARHHGEGRGRPGPRHQACARARARRRAGALDRDGRRRADPVGGECIGGIGVSGGDWATDERIAREAVEAIGASWK